MALPALTSYSVGTGSPIHGGRWPGGRLSGAVDLVAVLPAGTLATAQSDLTGNVTLDAVAPAGTFDDGMPSWRSGMAVNEIKNLASATWPYSAAIINAWAGFARIGDTSTIVSAANGGHTDTSDNGVYSLDVNADSPTWVQRIAPSAVGDRIPDVEYYADGKPSSRHGYTHAHWVPQRNRVMLFGGYGTWISAYASEAVDGVNVATWEWDAAGTWADLTAGRGYGQGVDPTTGNCWSNAGWLWDQAANTWSQPGTQQISTSGTRSPWAYDSAAGNFFSLQWSDNWGYGADAVMAQQFNTTTGARTVITLNSSSAATQLLADKPVYAALQYIPALDAFLFYGGQSMSTGSLVDVPGRIYKISKGSPNWDVSVLTVTGDTPAAVANGGINGRFVYIPDLSGVFCVPTGSAAPWFIRTH